MISRGLLRVLAIVVVSTTHVWADDLEQAARDAVAAKRFREAAALYTQLSEREPENGDYFVWLGRLAGWTQEYQTAIDAYDHALARAPRNVEALVGRASVLMWQRNFSDAYDDLTAAEQLESDNADVRLALARFYHYQHEERLAQAYVQLAIALAPADRDAREFQSHIVVPRPLHVTMGYGRDDFSFASAATLNFLTATYSSPRHQFAFQYERWNKFGEEVERGGGSMSALVGDHLWLRAGAMIAPGTAVLTQQDYSAGVSHVLPRGLVLGGDYRRLQLRDAHVDVVSPGMEYYVPGHPVWLQAIYAESRTQFHTPAQSRALNPSILIRYNEQLGRAFVVHAGYAYGQESFATLSVDQLGRFRANTYSGSVDMRMSAACSLGLSYAYQQRFAGSEKTRPTDVRTLGVTVSVRR